MRARAFVSHMPTRVRNRTLKVPAFLRQLYREMAMRELPSLKKEYLEEHSLPQSYFVHGMGLEVPSGALWGWAGGTFEMERIRVHLVLGPVAEDVPPGAFNFCPRWWGLCATWMRFSQQC